MTGARRPGPARARTSTRRRTQRHQKPWPRGPVAPTRSPRPASDPNQAAPGPTDKRSRPRPAPMDMARAATRLPAPTASPAGDRVDRLRAATAAIRNQGSRPRQGRTGDRYRQARLNSHRSLGVQAAIRSDRRPAARHHGPSAPGGSRPSDAHASTGDSPGCTRRPARLRDRHRGRRPAPWRSTNRARSAAAWSLIRVGPDHGVDAEVGRDPLHQRAGRSTQAASDSSPPPGVGRWCPFRAQLPVWTVAAPGGRSRPRPRRRVPSANRPHPATTPRPRQP
jgi:hypothetical protein